MRERDFQSNLIKRLKVEFPGCYVIKNDSGYKQGIPDLLILWGERWAALEVKSSIDASERPNQRYHVERLHLMSFAAFVYPENVEDIIYELQHALGASR